MRQTSVPSVHLVSVLYKVEKQGTKCLSPVAYVSSAILTSCYYSESGHMLALCMKKFDKSTNPASETIFFQMIFCGIRQHILF